MKQRFKLTTSAFRHLLMLLLCLQASAWAWADDTWSVAGEPETVFGARWDTSQNDMTLVNGTYQWTSNVFTFTETTTIAFKVVKDHAWDEAYPSSNYVIENVAAGTYTLTVTFNEGTKEVSPTLIPDAFYLMDDHEGWDLTAGHAFALSGATATLSGVELDRGNYFFFSNALGGSASDWSGIASHRYGPASGTAMMTSGTSYTAASGNDNSYQPEKSGVWSFSYNLSNHQWTGTLTAASASAKWYLVTSYGANNFTWSHPLEMTRSGNTFTYTKAMTAGDYFIFAQQVGSDWNASTRYTCSGGDVTIASGTSYSATRNGTSAYRVPTSGVWTFTYDYLTDQWSATCAPIDTNTGEMYVIGQANGNPWQAHMGLKMTASGNTFTLKNVQIIAGAEFAFATRMGANEDDWSGLNLFRYTSAASDGSLTVTNTMTDKDNPQPLSLLTRDGSDKNFRMEHTGRYNITVDWSEPNSPTVTIVRQGEAYPSLYMLGGPKSWAGNDGTEFYTTDGQTYTANMTLEHNTYFSFATQLGTSHDSYPADTYRFGPKVNDTEINNDNLNQSLPLTEDTSNSFKMTIDGIFKVVVTAQRSGDVLTPKAVTLQKIASVGNETIIHLEKTRGVTHPVLHAYNKERYNQAHGGEAIHIDRPSKEDLINTREVLNIIAMKDTTTADGRTWWSWKVENAIADFYFTRDESATDSEIQWRRAGELFFTWPNDGSTLSDYTRDYYAAAAQEIADCATMLEGHYYVYFTNTPGWNQVFCHAWYTDDNNPPANHDLLTPPHKPETVTAEGPMYPGALCTLVGYDKDGYEVWRYDFGLLSDMEHRPTGVIFNNGIQTVKLKDELGEEVRVLYDFNTGLETTMGKYQTGDFVAKNGGNYDYCGMISLGRSLGNIIRNGIVDGPPYTIEDDIEAVWLDEKAETEVEGGGKLYGALYCKDMNQFVSTSYVEKSLQQEGEIDYVLGLTSLMRGKSRYDQSNWVKLTLSQVNTEFAAMDKAAQLAYLRSLVGSVLKAETVTGQLVDNKNPEMRITERPTAVAAASPYNSSPNVFVAQNFVGTQDSGNDMDKRYFLVTPKPQEFATVTWVVYGGDNTFYVPTEHSYIINGEEFAWMNEADLDGGFKVTWDLQQKPVDLDNFSDDNAQHLGQAYKFHAIIRLADETATPASQGPRRMESQPFKDGPVQTKYVVSPIDLDTQYGVVTAITHTQAARTVQAVRYHNLAGMVSDKPFDGVNIVITHYTDGTRTTRKAVF